MNGPAYFHRRRIIIALTAFLLPFCGSIRAGDSGSGGVDKIVPDEKDPLSFSIADGNDVPLLKAAVVAWAPQWKWIATDVSAPASQGVGVTLNFDPATEQTIVLNLESSNPSPTSTSYKYTLTSTKDVSLTAIATQFLVPDSVTDATISFGAQDPITEAIPMVRADTLTGISRIILHLGGQDTTLDIDPPARVALVPRGFRLLLASDLFSTGTTTTTVLVTFSAPSAAPQK